MKSCSGTFKSLLFLVHFVLFSILLLIPLSIHAQEDGEPDDATDLDIRYDALVEDTITDRSFFDFFRFNGTEGEVIQVEMTARDGLAPLIGISASGGDVIARSDLAEDGSLLPEAQPNSTAVLTFELPETREYIIIATRVGNQDGTTTGAYTLVLQLESSINAPFEPTGSQQVTFRCGTEIATSVLTIDFLTETTVDTYRISVFSPDGMIPVLDVVAGAEHELTDCTDDAQDMIGNTFILPGEAPYTLEGEEGTALPEAAQLGLRGGGLLDAVRATVASVDDSPGHYMVVIDGIAIDSAEEIDLFDFRLGPLLAESGELLVYMVAAENTRIDPMMTIEAEFDEDFIICDDAGVRDCADVPAFTDYGVRFHDGPAYIGTRFSAGLRLTPGSTDATRIIFSSRARNATGPYAIIILGELPERESDE